MPFVTLLGQSLEISKPRRRIYLAEIAMELSARPSRAFAAAVGLGCRGLWGMRSEPKYDGRPSVYGEDVFELLSAEGASPDEIISAGLEVWASWKDILPSSAAVQEAKDFSKAGGEG